MNYIDNVREWIAGFEDRFWAFWSTVRVSFGGQPQSATGSFPVAEVPKQMSVAHQWTAIEDHLQSETDRAHSVLQMQETATRHLDAAHYALDRIAVELVDVMPSIMTVATVQPPRVCVPLERAEPRALAQVDDRSLAA